MLAVRMALVTGQSTKTYTFRSKSLNKKLFFNFNDSKLLLIFSYKSIVIVDVNS